MTRVHQCIHFLIAKPMLVLIQEFMNIKHLTTICMYLNLGTPIKAPLRVYGGLLHTMWRIDINKASYAIKQLSQDINLTDEHVVNNYELSEQVASRFANLGIPAINAIEKSGKHLIIIDGTGFLVYPWVDAQALDQDAISEKHALKIAHVLAKMHYINLDVPGIAQPEFFIYTKEQILKLIAKAQNFNCPFASTLTENQNNIFVANKAYQNSIYTLKNQVVVSHGDLDQKNVLWDKDDNPILIDWEAACKINSTYDIISAAFNWSGIATHFNAELFLKMINVYQETGGIINTDHLEAAFYGTFSWIGWLVYNIERSCVSDESEYKNLGMEQANKTLNTILRLQVIIPELIKITTTCIESKKLTIFLRNKNV